MPPSQLKRLKASLREQGVIGQPQSKKQRKKNVFTAEQKVQRQTMMAQIRDDLNPFEVKQLARRQKRDFTTAKTMMTSQKKTILGRPGISRALGEEKRRETLLLELQNRKKAGGIIDRRIGEEDLDMELDEIDAQRFVKERAKKNVFNLEDTDAPEDVLTHGGRDIGEDDFDAGSVASSQEDENTNRKRRREFLETLQGTASDEKPEDEEPERKKSKKEIMEEVINKSKLYKYERQKAKEQDDELRKALDEDLVDLQTMLRGASKDIKVNLEDPDKLYDQQIRALANDQRAKPSDRTETEQEHAKREAERDEMINEQRLKRMLGQPESEEEEEDFEPKRPTDSFTDLDLDDANEFGLQNDSKYSVQNNIKYKHTRPDGIDDEDDFLIEENLIASDSEAGEDEQSALPQYEENSDDDLLDGESDGNLPCPVTLEQVKSTLNSLSDSQYHDTIRQIRLSYDTALHANNKVKLGSFASSLVEFLADAPKDISSTKLDIIIRHIHSMARKFPDPISHTFRSHLRKMHEFKSISSSDLIILTAIGSIFPPSDHFHPIVTPAHLMICRWLGLVEIKTESDLLTGAYLVAITLKYQNLSKRFIPEAIRFTNIALCSKITDKKDQHINNLISMINLWTGHSAFIEMFSPDILNTLKTLSSPPARRVTSTLIVLLSQAQQRRKTLELHHHRPLPIKSLIPKFEEGFNPDKHYDPDPERAESKRLLKAFKKERKGAMRELRKDGTFLAREKLREKKERDKAYEEKYKRLVASIQGEEGKESNDYEREKRARKRARRR